MPTPPHRSIGANTSHPPSASPRHQTIDELVEEYSSLTSQMSSVEEKHKAQVAELEEEKANMQAKLDSLTKNLEMINNTISSDPAAAAAAAAAATTAASVPAGPDPATVAKWKEAEAALETAQSALSERTAEAERLKDELASVRASTASDAELVDAKMLGKEDLELQFAALQVS